jgi:hypothetical protein
MQVDTFSPSNDAETAQIVADMESLESVPKDNAAVRVCCTEGA